MTRKPFDAVSAISRIVYSRERLIEFADEDISCRYLNVRNLIFAKRTSSSERLVDRHCSLSAKEINKLHFQHGTIGKSSSYLS